MYIDFKKKNMIDVIFTNSIFLWISLLKHLFWGEKHHDQAHMSKMCSPRPKMTHRERLSPMRCVAGHMSKVGSRKHDERLELSQIDDLVKGQPMGFLQRIRAWSPLTSSYATYSPTVMWPTQQRCWGREEADNFGWILKL